MWNLVFLRPLGLRLSADRAEQAAEEAAARQAQESPSGQALEEEISPELEAEINDLLSDVDPDLDGDGEVSAVETQLAERTEDLHKSDRSHVVL